MEGAQVGKLEIFLLPHGLGLPINRRRFPIHPWSPNATSCHYLVQIHFHT
jgi:hypothetical protein